MEWRALGWVLRNRKHTGVLEKSSDSRAKFSSRLRLQSGWMHSIGGAGGLGCQESGLGVSSLSPLPRPLSVESSRQREQRVTTLEGENAEKPGNGEQRLEQRAGRG